MFSPLGGHEQSPQVSVPSFLENPFITPSPYYVTFLPTGVDGLKPRDEFEDINHDLVVCNGGPNCPYYQAQFMQPPMNRSSPYKKSEHSHSLMQETPVSKDDGDEENTFSGLEIVGHHISLPEIINQDR